MAWQIDGHAIPASIVGRGEYLPPKPPVVGSRGDGLPLFAPYLNTTWTFSNLDGTEYAYFATTVLAGEQAAVCTNNRLGNELKTETAYSRLIIGPISVGRIVNGIYYDVTVPISQMET